MLTHWKMPPIDIDGMGVSLPEQSFGNTFTAVPHRAIDRHWCVCSDSSQSGWIKIVVAHPGGSCNMAHFKFSVCSGIEYTVLPRFDLVDRHLGHAVRQQGAQQQVIGRIAHMGRRVAVTSPQKEEHSQYDHSRNDGISHWQPSLE